MLAKLLPVAKRVAKPEDARTDEDEGIDEAIESLGGAATAYVESTDFVSSTRLTAEKAVTHSKAEFRRLGINLRKREPRLDAQITEWRSRNVDLVKTMFDREKQKLREILTTGENRRYESLAQDIQDRCDITKRHAEFIARDQTLKLNANISHSRMQAAGVAEFVWTSAGDERVRPFHQDLDGQQFSFDDPPVTNDDGDVNLPGDDYQCRCVATPVLPELEADEGEDDTALAAE